MNRRGKIARLAKELRNELNGRLQNGETESALAKWLNRKPEVKEVMKEHFGGSTIRQQNVSEWKKGGYVDWLANEEMEGELESMKESAEVAQGAVGSQGVSDCFTAILAARMSRLARLLMEREDDPWKQWELMCAMSRQFSRMRKDDHRLMRTQLRREKWDAEKRKLENEEGKRQNEEVDDGYDEHGTKAVPGHRGRRDREGNYIPADLEEAGELAEIKYGILHPNEDEMYQLFREEVEAFQKGYELMMRERGTPLPEDFQRRWWVLRRHRLTKRKELGIEVKGEFVIDDEHQAEMENGGPMAARGWEGNAEGGRQSEEGGKHPTSNIEQPTSNDGEGDGEDEDTENGDGAGDVIRGDGDAGDDAAGHRPALRRRGSRKEPE